MNKIDTAISAVDWQPELDELAERQKIAREMGGGDRIARQHAGGWHFEIGSTECLMMARSWKSARSPAK
jgi:hypothetical protein